MVAQKQAIRSSFGAAAGLAKEPAQFNKKPAQLHASMGAPLVVQRLVALSGIQPTTTYATVRMLSGTTHYFVADGSDTVAELKHAIRGIPAHAGKGLRVVLNGNPLPDNTTLINGATYWVVYALPSSDDHTLQPPAPSDDDDDSYSDTNAEAGSDVGNLSDFSDDEGL